MVFCSFSFYYCCYSKLYKIEKEPSEYSDMKILLKTLIILALLSSGFYLFALLIQLKFKQLDKTPFYCNNEKVWAHRGFCDSAKENSITSFQQAFKLGAKGTELDVFFDVEMGEYIVSHDFPYQIQNDKTLRLEEVFQEFGKKKYYWLDFKNLTKLSRKELQLSLHSLLSLLNKYDLQEKCIVEAQHPGKLGKFSKAGIHTSYWIKLDETDSKLEYFIEESGYKYHILRHDFSAVSMRHKYYTPKVESTLTGIPVHLFTVNDKNLLYKFCQKDDVRIILSDNNYYSFTCID